MTCKEITEVNDGIPEMTNPLGRHWDQPHKDSILVDDRHAMMEGITFDLLLEYSYSQPSGVYEGKMWKTRWGSRWILQWFGPGTQPTTCSNHMREIIVI